MQNDILKRFTELSYRAEKIYSWVYSDFLDLQQQSILARSKISNYVLLGGYDGAERKIACFGSSFQNEQPPLPANWVKISPFSQKFADTFTHRDFLGALMNLGIERCVLGDLLLHENECYVFISESIVSYIIEALDCVRHTKVKCEIIPELPQIAIAQPQDTTVIAAANRADAIIASVYNISRNDALSLITSGKVFINSAQLMQNHKSLNENDIVSVRGYGRFIFSQVTDKNTRSGKLRIKIKKYT